MVVLKRLSRALSDGDRIYCVLRGSAVNQDGRSNGLTAPNGVCQQSVIRSALADAGLAAAAVDYVEAHGTGTALGDPIEMGALGSVFGPGRSAAAPLLVGSVKTNLGHLEGAAGIAGLIKVCLSLFHESLPPHLHFAEPSPHIDWRLPLQVPVQLTDWQRGERRRIAGVSSFGFGGTNAHVIVEESPSCAEEARANAAAGDVCLLTLSGKTAAALSSQARRYASALPACRLADICYTAATGRAHFPHRLALPASDRSELQRQLLEFAAGGVCEGVISGQAEREFSLTMLFGGQGGRHVGVGRSLYERDGTFRRELDRCQEVLSVYWPRRLETILWGDPVWWEKVDVQPALFCLQYCLGRLWESWGVEPAAVVGHSLGEYAAACLSGVFSLEDALKLVTSRARLLDELCVEGQMVAVFAGESAVRSALSGLAGVVDVAAVNGPRQTVVSGSVCGVAEVVDRLSSSGIESRVLPTTHAFHSPLVEPMLAPFASVASAVRYARPRYPYVSGLRGAWLDEELTKADYWCHHLREPVRFDSALACAVGRRPSCYLEVGAGTTVSGLVRGAYAAKDLRVLGGLRCGAGEWSGHLRTLGQLYVLGAPISWRAVWGEGFRKVSLPTYPFARKRYWFSGSDGMAGAFDGRLSSATAVHPLLGCHLDLGSREIVYETDLAGVAYLREHRLGETIVFPASGYLELALAAGAHSGLSRPEVQDLSIERPLPYEASGSCRIQVVLSPTSLGFDCRIVCWHPDGWRTQATCRLLSSPEDWAAGPLAAVAGTLRPVAEHYDRCQSAGLAYGPTFRCLRRLWCGSGESWGEVGLPESLAVSGYLLHPALLDACFQVTAGALADAYSAAWLPVGVDRYRLSGTPDPAARLRVHARLRATADPRCLVVDIQAADPQGQHLLTVDGLRLKPAAASRPSDLLHRERWVAKIRPREPSPTLPRLSPAEIQHRLEERRAQIVVDTGLGDHVPLLDRLESLSIRFVIRAFAEMRSALRVGESFTTDGLADTLGVAPDHARLFGRLLGMLREDGYLQREGPTWTVSRQPRVEDPNIECDRLLAAHPCMAPELTLLQRCADQLPELLRGGVDPLESLFPAAGSMSAADLYRDSVGGRALNALVAEAAAREAEALPAGRGLRILEVGPVTAQPRSRSCEGYRNAAPATSSQTLVPASWRRPGQDSASSTTLDIGYSTSSAIRPHRDSNAIALIL